MDWQQIPGKPTTRCASYGFKAAGAIGAAGCSVPGHNAMCAGRRSENLFRLRPESELPMTTPSDATMNPTRRLPARLSPLAALLPLVLAACASGPSVRAEYDKSVDFSRYKSFGFYSPLGTDRSGYETLVSQYLKTATRRELEARGLRYDEGAPQLKVNFNARLSEKLRTTTVPTAGAGFGYYGYRGGFYSAWPMYSVETTTTGSYTEGTLNIDLVDAARRQLVWEGVAVGTVTETSAESVRPKVEQAVTAVFLKFPLAPAAAASAAK